MSTTGTERYTTILHKQHGWIEAADGDHFRQEGKMVYLIEAERPARGDGTLYGYPFGTAWRASRILAYGN